MGRLVFLLEEESMRATLGKLMPEILPNTTEDVDWILIPHQGKSYLEKSIPRKMSAWHEPGIKFVIVRDNDGGDCLKLKQPLRTLASRRDAGGVLVRIICQSLETWFLGDLAAIKAAYPSSAIRTVGIPAKFRQPDNLNNASDELTQIVSVRGKVSRAANIASHMSIDNNRSTCFNVFVSGVRAIAGI